MTTAYYEMIEQSQTDDEYSEEERQQVAEWGSMLQSLTINWKMNKSERSLRKSAENIKSKLKTVAGVAMAERVVNSPFPSGELSHQRRLILEARKRFKVERPKVRLWGEEFTVFGGVHSAHIITSTGRKVTFKKLNKEGWEWV